MKISKLFHWLYACLMFLPLLVIPIFAVFIINHEPTPLTIETNEQLVVDFNQLVSGDDLRDDYAYYGLSVSKSGDTMLVNGYNTNVDRTQWYLNNTISLNASHIYVLKTFITGDYDYLSIRCSVFLDDNSRTYPILPVRINNASAITYYIQNDGIAYNYDFSIQCQLFDLTQMFGIGNEPTLTQFNTYFDNDYYAYVDSEMLVIESTSVTYSDTDIGSQYLYALYHTTDKYFNFDNVFNLGAISQWLDTNVFNGSTPLGFIIVWHYLDYWLLVSIFWLCFDVLIYVPQIAHRWLDKASLE